MLKLKDKTELLLRKALPLKVKFEKYVIKRGFSIKARIMQLGFIGTLKKIVEKIVSLNKAYQR